ncbi:MAG: hypothetical protein M3R27_10445, partial [Bacteroidota bacterium]|nr:hypothetical protein [Bacteroidota bacterium]
MKNFLLFLTIILSHVSASSQTPDWMWIREISGVEDQAAHGISIDSNGDLLIAGTFGGSVDFDPGPGIFSLNGGYRDIFILKLDSAGNFLWVRQFGSIQGEYSVALTLDENDNILVTGNFSDSVDFDPGVG